MPQAAVSSFFLVAVSEMGDKTQLLAFALAARYKRPWSIMAGILVATVVNHALAAALGSWLACRVSAAPLEAFLGATFVAFAFWTLKADEMRALQETSAARPLLTTIGLFFLAEMGDKTQLATLALGARYHSVAAVTLGSTTGMLVSDGLAVFLGDRLARAGTITWARYAAAALFFLFGGASLIAGFRAFGGPR